MQNDQVGWKNSQLGSHRKGSPGCHFLGQPELGKAEETTALVGPAHSHPLPQACGVTAHLLPCWTAPAQRGHACSWPKGKHTSSSSVSGSSLTSVMGPRGFFGGVGAHWGWFAATAAQKYPGSHSFRGLNPGPKGAKPEKAGIRGVCASIRNLLGYSTERNGRVC